MFCKKNAGVIASVEKTWCSIVCEKLVGFRVVGKQLNVFSVFSNKTRVCVFCVCLKMVCGVCLQHNSWVVVCSRNSWLFVFCNNIPRALFAFLKS